MQYQLTSSSIVTGTDESGNIYHIPADPNNAERQQYEAWLAADPENNVPQPAA